ncbi:RNA polymerase-associated protein RapA [Halotalea alkalilenta]|uniref:RNA polymerase-associated protein RapA n=1 Tax=Halotalea alkalilenta TaxID=376489 RepID=A0A172YJF0_9GAMM|nr:RNA polymerase-associated protein RapA [Halotalea alkalilenta]ANF59337.1 RNA polymerase-binding ATPase [Halotalea alkalilenta]
MSEFIPGQRWISDGEAELGLGTILKCDFRTVMVLFNAREETRTYSVRQAPLTRVAFSSGDRVESDLGERLRVVDTKEIDGLLTYICQPDGESTASAALIELPEARLNDKMQFHQARDRLLTGQVDRNDWFNLRYRSLQHIQRLQRHAAHGFCGPRIDLVSHQLAIADEVSSRHRPRVLLADEVGLGKTIEAGLILHRLLLNERISRVLVLVPASLCHQWLVELLRRFDLAFTLLDEHQSEALERDANPFESSQWVIASQQWLFANPRRQREAEEAGWDLLIVDEAHHLDASDEESGYACVERLAGGDCGLLLLTATPEQMGIERHFERLRLLDPERYHDLERFRAEEQGFARLADQLERLGEALDTDGTIDAALVSELATTVGDDQDARAQLDTLVTAAAGDARDTAHRALRQLLLDRHGIGRVMFHNSRREIEGFPERRLSVSMLEPPMPYRRVLRRLERDEEYLDTLMVEHELAYPDALIYPELTYTALAGEEADPWWRLDPRVEWLRQWVKTHPGQKALVICHSNETARDLATALQVLSGQHVPVFHEGTSLVERDRAAADFADAEDGSPLLICSEIGSEGRNFQFCHHLVLFDLPPHPDLLEQRIGRLDRIGQRFPIELHVACFEGAPDGALMHWYRDGVEAFGAPNGLGGELFEAFNQELDEALLDADKLDGLVERTAERRRERLAERAAGRYRLLAKSIAERGRVEELKRAIIELDEDAKLPSYLEQAFDVFGVETSDLGDGLLHLVAGPHMLDGLPGLAKGEEGFTATLSRAQALSRDDVQRLSWEHPLVREMLGRALEGTLGNTALALLKHPAIPGGRLMAEMVFVTHTPAPRRYQAGRFLPPTTVRVLLDDQGQNLTDKVSFGGLAKNLRKVKRTMARDLIKQCLPQLRDLLERAEVEAERTLPTLIEDGQQRLAAGLDREIARLRALAGRNPAVRDEEIDALVAERGTLSAAINDTRLRLDAVRVIVTVGAED